MDASCQVAHAITVHAAEVEDDYFTAVDDLNPGDEDRGAGHIGELGFGAGLFYSYICIDRQQLIENLAGDADLADRGVATLVEAITKTSPKGKQNSFGSRARAVYTLAERGDEQPRSLSVAFMRPVSGEDFGAEAIRRSRPRHNASTMSTRPRLTGVMRSARSRRAIPSSICLTVTARWAACVIS